MENSEAKPMHSSSFNTDHLWSRVLVPTGSRVCVHNGGMVLGRLCEVGKLYLTSSRGKKAYSK